MKLLKELIEQRIIEGDVHVPEATTKLDYHGAIVKGSFYCGNTKILSLHGSPSRVGGHFNCTLTDITSLEGAPEYVGTGFHCYNTKITSLQNIHKQIKYIGNIFLLSETVKSHILGVMRIKGLQDITFLGGDTQQDQVEYIVNKHLAGNRNIHECQEELIEAGLKEYARL